MRKLLALSTLALLLITTAAHAEWPQITGRMEADEAAIYYNRLVAALIQGQGYDTDSAYDRGGDRAAQKVMTAFHGSFSNVDFRNELVGRVSKDSKGKAQLRFITHEEFRLFGVAGIKGPGRYFLLELSREAGQSHVGVLSDTGGSLL